MQQAMRVLRRGADPWGSAGVRTDAGRLRSLLKRPLVTGRAPEVTWQAPGTLTLTTTLQCNSGNSGLAGAMWSPTGRLR